MPDFPRYPSYRPPATVPGGTPADRGESASNNHPLRPARNMLYDFSLPRLEREIETHRPRSASGVRPRNAVSPDTWATYQRVMQSYNGLPVHQSVAQIRASIRAHIQSRLPSSHRGPIVIVLGELHNTNGSIAQTMAVTQAMSRERHKVYLVESTPDEARECDYDASRAAIKLLESGGAQARRPEEGPLDQAEFAARVYPGREPPTRLRHVLQDACAKLTGFSIGGFDTEHDNYHDNETRERAMVDAVLQKGSQTGVTIVRAGAYHAPAIQRALKTLVPDAKVLCISQAADPSPTNRDAIHRMSQMFSDPDSLLLAGSDQLEADRVDLAPFVRHAEQRPDLVNRIAVDYRTL